MTSDKSTEPRLGIIGCGAIVEHAHLPTMKELGIRPALLVDPDEAQTRKLAAKFKGGATATKLGPSHYDMIDAALVAAPNTLHTPICLDLLQNGIDVLVEKPMATTVADCERIVAAVEASEAILAVGYIMRHAPIIEWTTGVLKAGLLGEVRSFDISWGEAFDWGLNSNSLWRKEVSGGGVLVDFGTHICDLVGEWFGDFATVDYRDDNYGGVEADCLIELEMASGAKGTVELSKTRSLRNSAVIEGAKGRLEISILKPVQEVSASDDVLAYRHEGMAPADMPERLDMNSWFARQMKSFMDSVRQRETPRVTARDGLRSVRLTETCYEVRQPWELPWVRPKLQTKLQQPSPARESA